MPIIDEERRDAGRMVLVMLKEAGTVALYNDEPRLISIAYCNVGKGWDTIRQITRWCYLVILSRPRSSFI